MSKRLFYQSVSTLYHRGCQQAIDHILTETDELLGQIQYQLQIEAPFWTIFLSEGRVVQTCRNCAAYFGQMPDEMTGQPVWRFMKGESLAMAKGMMDQCQTTGDAVVEVFPGRYGGRLGVVICPLGFMCEEGDTLGLVWPLPHQQSWFQFAFRSFAGLRGFMVMDSQGHMLTVDPTIAQRMGSAPAELQGHNYFDYTTPEHGQRQRAIIREAVWTGRPSTWIGGNGAGRQYEMFQVPFFKCGAVDRVVILGRELQEERRAVPAPALVRLIE